MINFFTNILMVLTFAFAVMAVNVAAKVVFTILAGENPFSLSSFITLLAL